MNYLRQLRALNQILEDFLKEYATGPDPIEALESARAISSHLSTFGQLVMDCDDGSGQQQTSVELERYRQNLTSLRDLLRSMSLALSARKNAIQRNRQRLSATQKWAATLQFLTP